MYVDGLLAENHGVGAAGFDPLLAESTGTADTPYDEQPYWPTPDPLPDGGTHLAYLDVWQREVTHLEDPGPRRDRRRRRHDRAHADRLAGARCSRTSASVDVRHRRRRHPRLARRDRARRPAGSRPTRSRSTPTTTRASCRRPAATAASRTRPTASRSTTAARRGRRRSSGRATTARSRCPVVEMVSTDRAAARVGRPGRRAARSRPATGSRSSTTTASSTQKPGEIRKVTVDDADAHDHVHRRAPGRPAAGDAARRRGAAPARAALGPVRRRSRDATGDAARRPRRRRRDRRDHRPGVGRDAGRARARHRRLVLDRAGGSGRFRAGDHWIFAARTADTSIEQLDAAPPLGVHHHYARLGVVTFPDSRDRLPAAVAAARDGDGETLRLHGLRRRPSRTRRAR